MIRRRGKFYVSKTAFNRLDYASAALQMFLTRAPLVRRYEKDHEYWWYEVICDLFDPISDFAFAPEYLISPEVVTTGFQFAGQSFDNPKTIAELLRRTRFTVIRKRDIGLQ